MRVVSRIRVILIFSVLVGSAFGATRYIAQSAGTFSGGTACNGRTTITPASWNGITNAAGDVNYLCGAITFSSGSNGIAAVGSGSSASPVQLVFDTGAILQSPAFGGSPGNSQGGAVVLSGVSYWTVNGQNVGIIQNTANGSPGQTTCIAGTCTVSANTVGIWISNATNITVENLTVQNMYMDLNGAGTWANAGYTSDIWIGGPATNIALSGNAFNDAHTGIWAGFDNGTINNLTIGPNNTISHHAWGISWANGTSTATTTSNGSIYQNTFSNYSDWNLSGNSGWHTDGIITYTYSTTAFNPVIYDNLFTGDIDGGTGAGTAHISVGTNYGAMSSGTGSGTIYNNVIDMTSSTHCAAGLWVQGTSVAFYNNTIIGPSSCSTGTSIGVVISGTGASFKNNIFSTLADMIGGYEAAATNIAASNNNVFYNCRSSNCFGFGNGSGPNYSSLSSFSSATGFDSSSTSLNPLLSGYIPQTGSSAVGLGANLTPLGIAPLDLDKESVRRPSSGAWAAGAYQYSPIAAPSSLTASAE